MFGQQYASQGGPLQRVDIITVGRTRNRRWKNNRRVEHRRPLTPRKVPRHVRPFHYCRRTLTFCWGLSTNCQHRRVSRHRRGTPTRPWRLGWCHVIPGFASSSFHILQLTYAWVSCSLEQMSGWLKSTNNLVL